MKVSSTLRELNRPLGTAQRQASPVGEWEPRLWPGRPTCNGDVQKTWTATVVLIIFTRIIIISICTLYIILYSSIIYILCKMWVFHMFQDTKNDTNQT